MSMKREHETLAVLTDEGRQAVADFAAGINRCPECHRPEPHPDTRRLDALLEWLRTGSHELRCLSSGWLVQGEDTNAWEPVEPKKTAREAIDAAIDVQKSASLA